MESREPGPDRHGSRHELIRFGPAGWTYPDSRGHVYPADVPKTFDALFYLVRNAEHLVSKRDLMDTLWPSTFVSEANLTNTVVSLRKVLGQDAIRTVSKHGYRFVLPVQGEPGIARPAEARA